jgi:RNA polymerase sigma-70 factor (ECF subfamily)
MDLSADYNERLESLLLATAQGDQAAFRRFYEVCSSRLYPVALRILREEGRAAECLQDAFLKIWLKAGEYEAGRSPLAWAAAIVRYQAIDLLRRLPKDLPDWEEADWEREDWNASRLDGPCERERQMLEDCLSRLPQDQRQAISQAFYRAATDEEVAQFAGAALGTVKSWIRRGLLALRECLEHGSA